uniref:Uncharacterized protein n=1 Tax=Compsopogon caeruleus TaxID=31354 RepID=A0A6T6BWQ2_9RHOD
MLDRLGVDQPQWKELASVEDAKLFCSSVGYPVLVRPSYVLSGAAMNVAHKAEDLEAYLSEAATVSPNYPVVISKFILEAKEIEVDAVARKGELVMHVVSEHVENAGVHSGDATIVLPPQDLDAITVRKVEEATRKVANELNVTGPMNIQFIAKNNEIKVIECNLRASRSFPFVSKTVGLDLARMATKVILDRPVRPYPIDLSTIKHVGVKVSQFSFTRLVGSDPILGVEMASTGEVACFGASREEAYLKAWIATQMKPPQRSVCISIGTYKEKLEFLDSAKTLVSMGFLLYATPGTADFLDEHNVKSQVLVWPTTEYLKDSEKNVIDMIRNHEIELLVNIPSNNKYRRQASFMSPGYLTRRAAVDHSVPLVTNIKEAKLLVKALLYLRHQPGLGLSPFDARFSARVITLPGLVSLDPGEGKNIYGGKCWQSLCSESLSGGFTFIVVIDPSSTVSVEGFREALVDAEENSICSFGMLAAASPQNVAVVKSASKAASGLLIDPNENTSVTAWHKHLQSWPSSSPIFLRASGHTLASVLLGATLHDRDVHVQRVCKREDIELISTCKSRGLRVTCDVSILDLYPSPSSKLISQDDREALWENLQVIDAVTGPPKYVLPLLLQLQHEGRISFDWIISRLVENPQRILGLNEEKDSYIEVDMESEFESPAASPVSGCRCRGRVGRVVHRGEIAYLDGNVWLTGGLRRRRLSISGDKSIEPERAGTVPLLDEDEAPVRSVEERALKAPRSFTTRNALPERTSQSPGTALALGESVSSLSMDRVPSIGYMGWSGSHILSVKQFNREQLHTLFNEAYEMKQMVHRAGQYDLLRGKTLTTLFFEPSTRTSCSFQAAMLKLGGNYLSVNEVSKSSLAKGETLQDTVRVLEGYCDAIVVRHPEVGAVQAAAAHAKKPVINGGDGVGEHPTQALLDVFTIREELGTVNGLTVTLVGDLLHGRTVHSLARVLSRYSVRLRYVSPAELRMPADVIEEIAAAGVDQVEHDSLEPVLRETDVLYVTRIQKERFSSLEKYMEVRDRFIITPKTLTRAKENMIVMHPLPRVNEVTPDVDSDPRAVYFRQAENGVYVRMALLALVLGRSQ